MIPLAWLKAIPTDRLVKIVFGLGFALCFFLIGMGVHKTFSDRKIARIERDFAEQRATLNAEIAEAEQHARKIESQWRADSVRMEKTYLAALAARDRRVRDLVVAGNSLQQRLDSITAHASSAATSSTTCRDVHKRVETLGLLLREADGLAEESGRTADDLRDELALCRSYVEAVTKQD